MSGFKLDAGVFAGRAESLLSQAGFKSVRWKASPKRTSRNTLILCGEADGRAVFAKMSRNSVGKAGEGEAETGRALSTLLACHPDLAAPRIYGVDATHGVLVSEYAEGGSADEALRAAARAVLRGEAERDAVRLPAVRMGQALAWLHGAWRVPDDGCQTRLYIDFGPKNLIFRRDDGRAVFIDPPECVRLGPPEADLGVALFEISRVMMRLARPGAIGLLAETRAAFLAAYGEAATGPAPDIDLAYREETRHLRRVMGRYARFWRYPDWGRQAVRGAALIPATLLCASIIWGLRRF